MCGGQIEPDDLALRDELIICPFCSTLNRITATGTEKSAETVHQRRRPTDVKIERTLGGNYLFHVKGWGSMFLPSFAARLLVIVPALWFIYSFFLPFLQSGYLKIYLPDPSLVCFPLVGVVWLIFVVMSFKDSFSYMPPIKLTTDTLFASEFLNYFSRRERVAIKDIRQIYTIAHKTPRIPDDSLLFYILSNKKPGSLKLLSRQQTNYSIYALTQNNKRIRLLTHIPDGEVALYVEEALEIALGLFNLPVYGDQTLPREVSTPVNTTSSRPTEPTAMNCSCCGSPLPVNPDSNLIGYVVCSHCQVLSLLYGAGKNKLVLGRAKLNSPDAQFEITKLGKQLRIRPRDLNQEAVLLLSKTDLGIRIPPSQSFTPLNSAQITNIFVKEVNLPGPSFGIDFSTNDQWAEELAHSGDLEKSYKRIHGTLFYIIIVKTIEEKEICILDQVRSPFEALELADRISYLYQLKPGIASV